MHILMLHTYTAGLPQQDLHNDWNSCSIFIGQLNPSHALTVLHFEWIPHSIFHNQLNPSHAFAALHGARFIFLLNSEVSCSVSFAVRKPKSIFRCWQTNTHAYKLTDTHTQQEVHRGERRQRINKMAQGYV